MKYIKTYEAKKNTPEVGDYVIVNITNNFPHEELKKVLNKSIGKIIDIDYNRIFGAYGVEFENVLSYKNYDIPLHINEIKNFSKNKKQLELELEAETYNL